MPYFERPDAEIYYEVWGESGPWLTLLNGYTRSIRDFRLLAKGLGAPPRRILVLDHRGAGKTRARGKFTFDQMGEDVAALWEHLEVEGDLLGISMGGTLAQWLAGKYAPRVKRLVLVSTAPNFSYVEGDRTPWSADRTEVRAKLEKYFTKDFRDRNRLLVDAMVKEIARAAETGDFLERAAAQRQAMDSGAPDAWHQDITADITVIHGTEDRVVPVEAAKKLAEIFPTAKLHLLPGVGHLLLAECPRQLEALVKETLA